MSQQHFDASRSLTALEQVFGRRQRRSNHALRRPAAEKRQGTKSRREAVRRACRRRAVPRERYGDLVAGRDFRRFASATRLEERCNLNVSARILLNGDFTFCPICDFNGLNGQGEHVRQPLRDELHDELWPTG
jgi:hypothetical protein